MSNLVGAASTGEKSLKARPWAGYVNMVTAQIEQSRRVMKFGGLSQPEVAKHLQSSRASIGGLGGLGGLGGPGGQGGPGDM